MELTLVKAKHGNPGRFRRSFFLVDLSKIDYAAYRPRYDESSSEVLTLHFSGSDPIEIWGDDVEPILQELKRKLPQYANTEFKNSLQAETEFFAK